MVLLDKTLIEDELFEAKFCCDVSKCKGACCTFPGEYGAPLLESEIQFLEDCYPIVKKYLSQKSIDYIEYNGMYEGRANYRTTVCIDKCDCVFVYYEGDIALCAIEKAYLNGEITFRKPISCHLYPIRVKKFGNELLHYSQIDECQAAREKGEKENIPLFDSLESSLKRKFGERWYELLQEYIKERNASKCAGNSHCNTNKNSNNTDNTNKTNNTNCCANSKTNTTNDFWNNASVNKSPNNNNK